MKFKQMQQTSIVCINGYRVMLFVYRRALLFSFILIFHPTIDTLRGRALMIDKFLTYYRF